jgi:hypothetical protein
MSNKMTQTEINKRLKQVTMEAEFRFKCLELASSFSKDIKSLTKNATSIYNYAFHINEEVIKNAKKNEDKS